jgi:hypothetical protein
MSYRIIQPPFTLDFAAMSKKELQAYAAWFQEVLPERVAELTKAVKSTPGHGAWDPDLTPESLQALGSWFEGQAETRKQTGDEVEELRAKLVFPIDVSDRELTNRTFSLAVDIGMYFSQVVLKNLPGTRWDQILKNQRFADYGQPVIVGFGNVPMNPVRLAVVTAYGVVEHQPARLRDLYETWARMRAT